MEKTLKKEKKRAIIILDKGIDQKVGPNRPFELCCAAAFMPIRCL
jgi:hypothetical protein